MTTPADIIAKVRIGLPYESSTHGLTCAVGPIQVEGARAVIAALDAAGYDIVARDPRPATCPTCGSDDPDLIEHGDTPVGGCPNAWHGGAK